MAAVAVVDVGDAQQRDSVQAVAVQFAFFQVAQRCLADHTFRFCVALREDATFQVGFNLSGPALRLRLERQQHASARGWASV